jgi:hypothetical protein
MILSVWAQGAISRFSQVHCYKIEVVRVLGL